jgi:hypothetical protein
VEVGRADVKCRWNCVVIGVPMGESERAVLGGEVIYMYFEDRRLSASSVGWMNEFKTRDCLGGEVRSEVSEGRRADARGRQSACRSP